MKQRYARLASIREAAIDGVRSFYGSGGSREAAVPVLVGITGACENVSTLFRVEGGARIHLTQTGQLALEHALCESCGVWCVTPSFRTDRIDERHLNEFTLVEEELTCEHPAAGMSKSDYDAARMFEVLLTRISTAVKAILAACLEASASDIDALGGDCDGLDAVLREDFRRITYSRAVEVLNEQGGVDIRWGADLTAGHERLLMRILDDESGLSLPTFVTHYPAAIKFFNMKVDDENPRVVQSADLLLPCAGEAVGSAVREHRYEKLVHRLTSSVMYRHIVERGMATVEDFEPYLDIIREGRTAPHAGYGIGLERVLQFVIGSGDIRQASVTHTLSTMMGFADTLAVSQSGSRAPGF